ncbi:MAG TPA: multiheme c-type cytochrome [Kofleriaceae bacterium]|nr:multiheme c-type cytochrome [Kofleriaceae bacterium]
MLRRVGLIAALAAAACSKSEVQATGNTPTADPAPPRPTFTVLAVAEVRGQIGPCGCTTDPLGDISRTSKLVEQARAAGPVLFVDAGSLLYSQAQIPPMLDTQEELKATLLADTYQKVLKVDALGLGPADMSKGVDHLRLPRLVSNAPEVAAVEPKVIEVGGAKAGVFGVIAEGAVHGLSLGDPVMAGKAAVARLRGQGARVVIGLIQADSRKEAIRMVRDIGGIDLAIAGLGLGAPEPDHVEIEAQRVGDGWLIVPVNRGQIVARVTVTVRDPGPLADAVGPGAATARLAQLDKLLAALDADLAAFARDSSADEAFVKAKQQERAKLAADRDRLKSHPLVIPQHGSFFTLEQVRINKALACDTQVQDAVSQFYRASGEANMKAAASIPVTPPPRGGDSYTGTESCSDCHSEAVEFWKKTVHAGAWKTLEERGQQFDLDCIGCHVTGWGKPGGSNLGHNEKLRDIQCETCHGPGSIHVAKGGLEKPFAIWRGPPADLCASQCHTKEHSDTFQLEPYLRDVLGPGHGQERRKKLGDGPTGAQLRKAALDKAGRELGAGCTR